MMIRSPPIKETAMGRLVKMLLGVVVALALAGAAAWVFLPTERIIALAADQVRAATGRELAITGTVRPSLWPDIGAEVEGVSLSNADWATDPQMVTATRARITVALLPLLSGQVRVTGLELIEPKVSLEVASDGRRNWDFAGAKGAAAADAAPASPSGGASAPAIGIDRARITGGALRFRDASAGRDLSLPSLDADLTAPSLDQPISLDAKAIWNGAPASVALTLSNPAALLAGREAQVTLSLAAAGAKLGWTGGVAVPALAGATGAPTLSGELTVRFGAPGKLLSDLGLADLSASLPPEASRIDTVDLAAEVAQGAEGLSAAVKLTVGADGVEASLSADVTGGADWAVSGPLTVDAALAAGDAGDLKLTGVARDSSGALFAGRMEFSGAPRKLAALAGVALTRVPDGALQTAALSGALRVTATSASLDGGKITVDDIAGDILGGADWSGAKPVARAAVTLGALDLRPWMAGAKGGDTPATATAQQAGWPRDPIDLSGLGAADLDLSLAAGPVTLPQGVIDRLAGKAVLKSGVATMTLERAEMFGGLIVGAAKAGGAGAKTAISGDLKATGVGLRPLLTALGVTERVEGTGDLTASIAATGGSMDAMMRALSGNGVMELRDGAIIGLDLASVVRNLSGGGEAQRTDFTAITASWTIARGVLTNQDLRLAGPLIRVEGAGTVDIGAQTLEYRVTPKAVATIKGQGAGQDVAGLSVPVDIRGPWAGPSIQPDLAAAAQGLLKDPAGAADQVKSLLGGASGGAAGLLQGGLNALTGGATPAPAADPAPAPADDPATPASAPAPAPAPANPADALNGLFQKLR
ncbi:MAG: hypothetical protein ACJA1L_003431 [Paracoccaceae bacterium]|jgi:uncharacterized protein involved in outer membrane biogenesis